MKEFNFYIDGTKLALVHARIETFFGEPYAVFAHCARIDFGNQRRMTRGVAREFAAHFEKPDERDRFSKYLKIQSRHNALIITLQTNRNYYEKPRYSDYGNSIFHLSDYLVSNNIKAITLPALGEPNSTKRNPTKLD